MGLNDNKKSPGDYQGFSSSPRHGDFKPDYRKIETDLQAKECHKAIIIKHLENFLIPFKSYNRLSPF
jgi:hypothetical protein